MQANLRVTNWLRMVAALIFIATLLAPESTLAQQRPRGGRRRAADAGESQSGATNAPAEGAKPKEKKLKLVAEARELVDYPVPSRIRPVVVSADGRHLAYELVRGERHLAMVDGREIGVFARLWNLKLSPEGSRAAFVAQRSDDERKVVVLDGREVGAFADVATDSLAFSRSGDRFGFIVRKDGTQPEWLTVIDGETGPAWEELQPASLTFSGDSSQAAFVAQRAGRWHVVVNGQPGPAWDEIAPRSLSFSRTGGLMAYAARSGTNWHAVIDGKTGVPCAAIADGMPVLSHDGKHVAYGARRDGRWQMVVDGTEHKTADRLEGFVFSPDGGRHAYVARQGGKDVVVVDGKDDKDYGEIPGPLAFSPDGKRFAFVAIKDGRPLVVVDGKEVKAFDEIGAGPLFGPDGKHCAWLARAGEKWLAVMDGTESADSYNECKAGLVFREANRIAFYAIKRDAAGRDDLLAVAMTLVEE